MRALLGAAFAWLSMFAVATAEVHEIQTPGGEIEPGRVYVPADLRSLQETIERPASDTDAILRAQGDDLNRIPPPLLVDRGRRIFASNREEGVYIYYLGYFRMQFDAFSCASSQSGGFVSQVGMMIMDDPIMDAANEPALKLAAYRRLQENGAVFTSEVSAFYLCSHTLGNLAEGLVSRPGRMRTIPLSEWRASEASIAGRRTRFAELMPQWIAELERTVAEGH